MFLAWTELGLDWLSIPPLSNQSPNVVKVDTYSQDALLTDSP